MVDGEAVLNLIRITPLSGGVSKSQRAKVGDFSCYSASNRRNNRGTVEYCDCFALLQEVCFFCPTFVSVAVFCLSSSEIFM